MVVVVFLRCQAYTLFIVKLLSLLTEKETEGPEEEGSGAVSPSGGVHRGGSHYPLLLITGLDHQI